MLSFCYSWLADVADMATLSALSLNAVYASVVLVEFSTVLKCLAFIAPKKILICRMLSFHPFVSSFRQLTHSSTGRCASSSFPVGDIRADTV